MGRQEEVLQAIKRYHTEHGFMPTFEDIMKLTDITSKSMVNYYLNKLKDDGLITRQRYKARSIVITKVGRKARKKA